MSRVCVSRNEDDDHGSVVTLELPYLLDCRFCLQPLRAPVYQCDNGHLACHVCCKEICDECVFCSLPINNRCIAIEMVVESAEISCENIHYGCTERVSYVNKLEHKKTCKYTPISCPQHECDYIGSTKHLYMHFAEKHSMCETFVFNTVKLLTVWEYGIVFLQEKDEKILFVLNRVHDPLGSFVYVKCVAPAASDMRFSYELRSTSGHNSINLKCSEELTPECFAEMNKDICLLIPNVFNYDCRDFKMLDLELVIRKPLRGRESRKEPNSLEKRPTKAAVELLV